MFSGDNGRTAGREVADTIADEEALVAVDADEATADLVVDRAPMVAVDGACDEAISTSSNLREPNVALCSLEWSPLAMRSVREGEGDATSADSAAHTGNDGFKRGERRTESAPGKSISGRYPSLERYGGDRREALPALGVCNVFVTVTRFVAEHP